MLLDDDFLLTTLWAKRLYHGHAEGMPIIDYHCHLDPQAIWEDRRWEDLSQVWLRDGAAGDHYKWRLMRANGVPERVITGEAEPYERYLAFVRALERAPGNPVFEWSHLELRRVFGIDLVICEANAREIWDRANERIAEEDFSARGLVRRFDVRCLCTTDGPISDLRFHRLISEHEDEVGFRVLPTFRPDGLTGVDQDGFAAYCGELSRISGIEVRDWEGLKAAAAQRLDAFHEVGGRLADHGANSFRFVRVGEQEVARTVATALGGGAITSEQADAYQSALTLFLMGEYARRGWTLQVHGNCLRNDSSVGLAAAGRDAGFDSVGDQADFVSELARLLDAAQAVGDLPKMVLYSLNESDYLALATLCGSFQGDPAGTLGDVRQRVHFGNAWWFCDTFSGMKHQLTTYAEQSLLGNFVGMLTDSRSFLSYPRHEYFRRVLCHMVGEWVEQGRLPEDEAWLGGLVEDICYNNAHEYFGFFS